MLLRAALVGKAKEDATDVSSFPFLSHSRAFVRLLKLHLYPVSLDVPLGGGYEVVSTMFNEPWKSDDLCRRNGKKTLKRSVRGVKALVDPTACLEEKVGGM